MANAGSRRPGPESVRLNRLGSSVVRYSTEASQQNSGLDSISGGDSPTNNDGANSEIPLPKKEDYNGFGNVLLGSPFEALEKHLAQRKLIALHPRYLAEGDFRSCVLRCHAPCTGELIYERGIDESKVRR